MITYNHASLYRRAIEGVLKQKTIFPIELVIGEDCSTDGTRDIVLEYQKKYSQLIRMITSDKNVGMRKNCYRTIKACRGKYIAFCEGDDYWHHPDKLQKQANYMESHPECGLVYSSYDVYHVGSEKKISNYIKYRSGKIRPKLGIIDFVDGKRGIPVGILTCTVIVRRDICLQIIESDPYLHQSDHFLMADTQLWAEIASVARVQFIPESFATHYITGESATRSKDIKKRLQFAISGAKLMIYLCNKYNLPLSIRNKHEANLGNYLLQLAFHSRSAELADEVRKKRRHSI